MSGIQVKNICGLSPVQEGMYFHYLMNKDNDPYVIQSMYELIGHLDVDHLKAAFEVLVQRHDCLRTLFMHQKTPDPVQIILKSRVIPFEFTDLAQSDRVEATIQDYLKSDREKGFDLTRDPLVRIHVFRCEEQKYRLVMTLHHIILDGWSSGIIERELFMIYAGGQFRKEIENSAPVSFSEYIKWLKSQSGDQGIAFFKQKLDSKIQFSPFTHGRKREQGIGEEVHALVERVSGQDTQRLKALASDLRVTTSDLLRSIWTFTVARFTGQDSFTTLHTVSGRPAELHRSSEMVGMFINAMVQPYVNEDRSIRDVVRHQHELFAESMSWQHLSLSQIAKSLSVIGELSDNLVVLENYPEMGDERSELERMMGFRFAPVKSEESTNYPVTVQFHVGSTIEVRFFMKKAWFSDVDIQKLNTMFHSVLSEVLKDVFESVSTITRYKSITNVKNLPKDSVSVFITSNFTDSNLTPYLHWWMDQAGFDASITLADYNTVHQQVSDTSNTFSLHNGPKVILIKLSDLARFKGEMSSPNLESFLKESIGIIWDSVSSSSISGPIILALTPDKIGQHDIGSESLQRIGDQFIELNSRKTSIKILDLRDAPLRHSDLFDDVTDHMGHIPYSEAGYSFIASQIARTIRAWKHQPFKVIALDADNTLWKGVLGEDGIQGVEITPAHRYLQEFVLKKKDQGFVLALCTKNNSADVEEFFRVRDDMILKMDDFVSVAANWGAKSSNLKVIADDLNLGIDSFIFLDDSALEIREVTESQPDVLALQLPENLNHWKSFLDRNWAFDTYVVTQEDRQRTSMYLAEKKRREIAESNQSNTDFITQIDVKTTFYPLGEQNLDRIEQLTQRTNQFNLNGRRFTKSEVSNYASNPDHSVYSLSVSDRFGDYGITGALFVRISHDALIVDAWMLSCRVLARGVEHHVLHHLGDLARNYNVELIRFLHKKTPKNVPIQQFLSTKGFNPASDTDSEQVFIDLHLIQLADLPKLGQYEVRFVSEISEETIDSGKISEHYSAPLTSDVHNDDFDSFEYWVYENSSAPENHPRNSRYVGELCRLRPDLLEECRSYDVPGIKNSTPYEEPLTSTEVRMAAIWKTLLETDRIGRRHDFFLSGGNSLMATRLASRIYQEFKIELELGRIFESPILSDFCAKIDQEQGDNTSKITPLERVDLDFYPLSNAQHRIWRSEQLFESQAGYVLGGLYKIHGQFDLKKLKSALNALCNVHETLRTSFPIIEGEPRQVIHDEVQLNILNLRDFGDLTDPESINYSFFSKKLDLESGPLIEIGYAQVTEDEHLLAIKIHHLVTDGWSQGILMDDLIKFYESDEHSEVSKGARFVDFVRWSTLNESSHSDSAHAFWKADLDGDLDRVTLPYDYPRPMVIRKSPKQFRIQLDQRLTSSVNAFSRKHQLSLYMTMMASVQLLLQRYSGKKDIIVGSPFSGRTHPDVHQTVGFFVNTLPFRMNTDPEISLKNWLSEIRSKTIKLLEFQHVSLDAILSDLNVEHDQRPPLFDVLLLVQEQASDDGAVKDFTIESVGSEHLGAGYDVVFQVFDSPNGWELVVEYQPELYHERTISMVAEHWKAVLSNLTKAPVDQPISRINSYDDPLRNKLIQLGTGSKKDFRRQTLVDVFREAVGLYPASTAILNEVNESISYADLDSRTDSLARVILSLGVGIGDRVVVNIEKKSQVIECMLAIMKCRAVFVPVDSETPLARTEYILDVCKPKLWIVDSDLSTAEQNLVVSKISITDLYLIEPPLDGHQIPADADPDEMAYIIFTSGSTGRPKGVAVHHQGLVNMTHNLVRVTDTNQSDRVLCFASISFDASISEFSMGFLAGATLVCPPSTVRKDAVEFIQYLNQTKVSVVTLPPVFLASLNKPELPYLKSILTAGESARKTDALFYAKSKRYINGYGPTECSVGTNTHIVHPDATYHSGIPIGRAYDNVQLVVLDENLNLAPFGAQGQLAVSGVQVAIGYFGNPELTSKSFIDYPLLPGKTYLTGDQVRWNFNGELEFIGRNDTQVKIRGYRVELDEIKHQIDLIGSIQVSFVHVMTDSSGEKQLVAYIVEKKPTTDAELRKWLSENLPNYMIPGYFVRIDELKLTINGKVDVKALPSPFERVISPITNHVSTSSDPIQITLLETLSKFLPAQNLDLGQSFLHAGGDSIKAIQIAHHLQQQGFTVRAGQLYELRSLGQLIELMETSQEPIASRPEILPGIVGCNPMQVRFFHEVKDESQRNLFWMQAGFKLSKSISNENVRRIISEITDFHEIFRMRFDDDTAIPKVEITGDVNYQLVFLELESKTFEKDLFEYYQQIKEYIDIQSGRMTSFLVIHGPSETHIVATFHHLIVDAISLRILKDQFQLLSSQLDNGNELKLVGNYLTQSEWVTYIRGLKISDFDSRHWETLFTQPGLSIDNSTHFVSAIQFSNEATLKLQHISSVKNQSIDALLLAFAQKSLTQHLNLPSIRVGIETQGRKAGGKLADISSTMGWFTLEYPITLSASDSIQSILDQISKQTNTVHLDGLPALIVQNNLWIEHKTVYPPDLGFNYLGAFETESNKSDDWSWDSTFIPDNDAFNQKWHPLELSALIEQGELKIRLQSNTTRLDQRKLGEVLDSLQTDLLMWTESEYASVAQKPAIVCFPFVASNASFFDTLKQGLSKYYEIIVLELPGHGARIDEPLVHSLDAASDDLTQQIRSRVLPGREQVWLGHSMGAYLALTCAHILDIETGLQPMGIVFSDVAAPGQFEKWIVGDMSDAQKSEYYKRLGYDKIINTLDEVIRGHFESIIRADLAVVRPFIDPNQPIVQTQARFLYSLQDSIDQKDEWAKGWQRQCSKELQTVGFEGGHIDWLQKDSNIGLLKTVFDSIFQEVKHEI